jgi:predicted TIM-barrel enzyme
LEQAKEAIGDEIPLFVNTGAKPDNIQQFLSIANGVIVGSSLKVDGYTWNQVDPRRVERFMDLVKEIR